MAEWLRTQVDKLIRNSKAINILFGLIAIAFVALSINTLTTLSITVDTISLQFFSIIMAISIGFITIIVGIFNMLYDLVYNLTPSLDIDDDKLNKYLDSLKDIKKELRDNVKFLAKILAINMIVVLLRNFSFMDYKWPIDINYLSKDAILTAIAVWTILSGVYTLWDTVRGTFTLYEHYILIQEYRLKNKNRK
jgi:uncharacterized membrane protein HdeD (DUF308 family)